ncbi:MAG TPA: Fe-S protein assembly co-chaperone HscB [Vicinamibacterales bacterium]|nr:Fe-S protein assembly co-chaperone HscB [Vicinamibacterales bacterium]
MSPDSRALILQSCRHCGAGAPAEVHFCPQCERILTLTRHGDYFAFFGLPRRLTIDLADLERRFRALSRQFHPDYFYNASPAERVASLERASYLNDAYRVLRQPADRVEYLLTLEGLPSVGQHQDASQLQAGLLEEVFALNEELDEIRAARAAGASPEELEERLEKARRPVEARAAREEEELAALFARWDAQVEAKAPVEEKRQTLEALRSLAQESSYIANLLQLVARESNT